MGWGGECPQLQRPPEAEVAADADHRSQVVFADEAALIADSMALLPWACHPVGRPCTVVVGSLRNERPPQRQTVAVIDRQPLAVAADVDSRGPVEASQHQLGAVAVQTFDPDWPLVAAGRWSLVAAPAEAAAMLVPLSKPVEDI